MPKSKRKKFHRRADLRDLRKRRRLDVGILGVFVILFIVAGVGTQRTWTSDAQAQTSLQDAESSLHIGHGFQAPFDPLLNGSERPEDIPDSVAIRALMQTLRQSSKPDAAASGQLRATVNRMNLNEADIRKRSINPSLNGSGKAAISVSGQA